MFSMVTYRRRRAAQANLAYVQQSGGNAYGGQPAYAPQYPPQVYGGTPYDPNSGFAPVRPTISPTVHLPDH
jgi:hypothetical protein